MIARLRRHVRQFQRPPLQIELPTVEDAANGANSVACRNSDPRHDADSAHRPADDAFAAAEGDQLLAHHGDAERLHHRAPAIRAIERQAARNGGNTGPSVSPASVRVRMSLSVALSIAQSPCIAAAPTPNGRPQVNVSNVRPEGVLAADPPLPAQLLDEIEETVEGNFTSPGSCRPGTLPTWIVPNMGPAARSLSASAPSSDLDVKRIVAELDVAAIEALQHRYAFIETMIEKLGQSGATARLKDQSPIGRGIRGPKRVFHELIHATPRSSCGPILPGMTWMNGRPTSAA